MAKKLIDLHDKMSKKKLKQYDNKAFAIGGRLSFKPNRDMIVVYRKMLDEEDATERDVDPAGTP